MFVKDIMTRDPVTVQPETSIRDIAELLVSHKFSGLPVVNAAGHLVGMVSEGDLMHKEIAPKLPGSFSILGSIIYLDGVKEYKEAFRKFSARTAAELMTAKVISVNEDEDVSRVGQIMLDHHIKRVPVLSDGRLVGIVSRQDVVKMLLR